MDIEYNMSSQEQSSLQKQVLSQMNYNEDKYIQYFVPKEHKQFKSMPIYNRMYYTRCYMMQKKLREKIRECNVNERKVAILNLGSGFDTFAFTVSEFKDDFEMSNFVYIELDLPTVIHKKLNIIKNNAEQLLTKLNNNKKLFKHIDMRVFDLIKTESILELEAILKEHEVEDLIIQAEATFSYIQNEQVVVFFKKMKELVEKGSIHLVLFDYNICSSESSGEQNQRVSVQGKNMVNNLTDSGIMLYGLQTTPNKDKWEEKLAALSFKVTQSRNLFDAQTGLEEDHKQKMDGIEKLMTDAEKEEISIVMKSQFMLEAVYKEEEAI